MKSVVFLMSGAYEELREYGEMPGEWCDCRDLTGTSCYLDAESEAVLRERIAAHGDSFLRWIDSGDYHYISYFSGMALGRPYSLVLIDHHPDMQAPAFGTDVLSCGGWVRRLLEDDPFLHRVLIVGINQELVGETDGFPGRVTVYTDGQPVPPEAMSFGTPVLLSIDKDALSPDYARTDWDQGTMTLTQLEDFMRELFARNEVLGVDVCGELPASKGGRSEDRRINAATNLRLHQFLLQLFSILKSTPEANRTPIVGTGIRNSIH